MAQARVTDFYSQRKKGGTGSVKQGNSSTAVCHVWSKSSAINTRSSCSSKQDVFLTSSSSHVREEFMRVIESAEGVSTGESIGKTARQIPLSPRTPKRPSANTDFETDIISVATEHSTARKRRQVEVHHVDKTKAEEKATRTARKKLLLTHPTSQTFCRENITALKSRLQTIKKPAELANATSSTSVSTPLVASSITVSKSALTRAKELAAKVRTKKESDLEGKKLQKETQDQESVQQPAYQQYHNLAQETPPGLSLPYQFKILAEMFRSMDTVVAMLFNRSETATFFKIKQGVQDMMHKRFQEHHIGQMMTVFPEAYTFRQEKNIPTFNNCVKKGSYQLTVEPVILHGQQEGRPVLTASNLLARRRTFHQNLVSIVKQHHKVFLASLVPPVCVPEDKLTRWHPNFNVDMVPDVQSSLLPQPPRAEKFSTAQEVLDKAHSLITPKMEKALVALAQKTEDAECRETSPQNLNCTLTSAPPPVPNALKGVSQCLLDRIRAKEAQKLQAAMTRNPSQEERLLMMSQLGELARILRNVFVSEKKPALIMEVVCHRMVASFRAALTSGEMEKHIRLLAELTPDWLTIHPIRKDFYLKLNKNMDLSVILDKLRCRLREEERLSGQ
ncbi:DNA replication factor Cdt1 [Dunckerocampus dactyliophorus]|uniref:DNA replication factor Cdt1 n=1 Tax=Dunckerocampus dactyliophorus TaxID=161453 RepID=UPI0024053EA0|nr:DNA replication factor Cdt1 [Dunckerocampus dactyliophorus]